MLRPKLSVAVARAGAERAVGRNVLEKALADPWVEAVLQAVIRDYAVISRRNDTMPKLLLRDQRILHGLPETPAALAKAVQAELSP
jgi:hypothetical protein